MDWLVQADTNRDVALSTATQFASGVRGRASILRDAEIYMGKPVRLMGKHVQNSDVPSSATAMAHPVFG